MRALDFSHNLIGAFKIFSLRNQNRQPKENSGDGESPRELRVSAVKIDHVIETDLKHLDEGADHKGESHDQKKARAQNIFQGLCHG